MTIEIINDLSQRLVADDFSNGHKPSQAGPTKTSRAMAIIHLAAHDAYAQVTTKFAPRLAGLPAPPAGTPKTDAAGTVALLGAGFRAAEILYPDFGKTIDDVRTASTAGADQKLLDFGVTVANAWLTARCDDGSAEPQEDTNFDTAPGHHRRDPFNPMQTNLGRKWGQVKPFVLTDVKTDAKLDKQPALTSQDYANAFDQVFDNGTATLTERDSVSEHMATVGVYWGYDGSNKLGTPPRLFNQIVRKIPALVAASHDKRIRLLTAINVAMADAGIAAWYWKYKYDFWRPVVAIREAEAGWGPTGAGDGNTLRLRKGDPFWQPFGAPRSNPFPAPVAGAPGDNFTPNFPAYPSGHASFGTACFETVAALLGKKPEDISVTFASDEFNGSTTDHEGITRPRWVPTFTLREAIEENKISRIFLGVHWIFDATGGETVGHAVAGKVIAAFPV